MSALIPTSAALGVNPSWTASLGAVVVIMPGLRVIFRWHDDWLRFTDACAQLETELQFYRFRVGPYAAADRDEQLIRRLRTIETAETQGWLRMRRPSAGTQSGESVGLTTSPEPPSLGQPRRQTSDMTPTRSPVHLPLAALPADPPPTGCAV